MPDLQSLYRDIILDHYRSPRRRGELASPPAHRSEGFNPLCGDEVVVTFEIKDGAVADVAIGGQGCSISQASASMMSEAVVGKSIDEIRELASRFKSMMGIEPDGKKPNGTKPDSTKPDGKEPDGAAGDSAAGAADTADTAAGAAGAADTGAGAANTNTAAAAAGAEPLAHSMGDLEAMRGVIKFPVRIKCATLAWNALLSGLDELAELAKQS